MILTEKQYVLESSSSDCRTTPQRLVVHIREVFYPDGQALHTWDGGVCLAAFVAADPALVRGKRVLELGAGTGVPSIVSALLGAASCTATERDDARTLGNLRANVAANHADVAVTACDWHRDAASLLSAGVDVLLGADVLYSSEDFDPVLRTVAAAMAANPSAVFYTTYQERSNRRTLSPHLRKYGLVAEVVPLPSFLHVAHTCDGTVTLRHAGGAAATGDASPQDEGPGGANKRRRHDKSNGERAGGGGGEETQHSVTCFDSIFLIKVTKEQPT